MSPSSLLTIGQLAESCGVATSTIRFWERNGLIEPAARQSGQRRYRPDATLLVGTLRLCQDAGFTITEIRELFERHDFDRASWQAMIAGKLADIEQRQAKLERAHAMLTHAVGCEHCNIEQCPSFQRAVNARLGRAQECAPSTPGEAVAVEVRRPRQPAF